MIDIRNVHLAKLSSEETAALLPEGLIFLGFRGSIAHGMYVPQENPDSIDDKDIMGVYVSPREHYLGFGRPDVHERFIGEWDAVSYEVRKLIGLLLKGNPNVLSLLWLDPKHVIAKDPLWDLVIAERDAFVGKHVYHAFAGYAHGQFHRMTHGVKQGYMGAKRQILVEKYGFDCKNAAHLIRLLRMAIEFLTEGRLYVERADSHDLLAIKRGEWTLDRVKAEAEGLFRLAQEAYVRSPLPNKPDRDRAEALCVRLIGSTL